MSQWQVQVAVWDPVPRPVAIIWIVETCFTLPRSMGTLACTETSLRGSHALAGRMPFSETKQFVNRNKMRTYCMLRARLHINESIFGHPPAISSSSSSSSVLRLINRPLNPAKSLSFDFLLYDKPSSTETIRTQITSVTTWANSLGPQLEN